MDCRTRRGHSPVEFPDALRTVERVHDRNQGVGVGAGVRLRSTSWADRKGWGRGQGCLQTLALLYFRFFSRPLVHAPVMNLRDSQRLKTSRHRRTLWIHLARVFPESLNATGAVRPLLTRPEAPCPEVRSNPSEPCLLVCPPLCWWLFSRLCESGASLGQP